MPSSPRGFLLACALVAAPAAAFADPPQPTQVKAADLPAGVAPRGTLLSGWKFADKNGTNYVLFSSTQSEQQLAGGGWSRNAVLYVDDWAVPAKGKPKNLLPVREVVTDCPLDLSARFHDAAFEVTDLDKDGIAEVTFGYEVGCHGDVSPNTYKVLTLENGKLYALRGQTLTIGDSGSGTQGGDFKADPSFAKAPAAFLAHAKQVWAKTDADAETPPKPSGK